MLTSALLGVLAVAVIGWLATRGRLTRRLSWRQARQTSPQPGDVDTNPAAARRTGMSVRWSIVHDGFDLALRYRLHRAQRLAGRLAGTASDALTHAISFRQAADTLTSTSSAVRASESATPPTLSPEVAGRLNGALYLGDIAVVSGILMAQNHQMQLILAVITSLALATAQFAVGKKLGEAYISHEAAAGAVSGESRSWRRSPLLAPVGLLVLFGVCLAVLRAGHEWAWAFLAISPAIGAAGLTVVSHDDLRTAEYRAKRAYRKPRKRLVKSVRRLGRATGRAAGAWTAAGALATRRVLAPEQAVAASYGLTVAADTRPELGGPAVDMHSLDPLVQAVHSVKQTVDHLAIVDFRLLDGGFDTVVTVVNGLLAMLDMPTPTTESDTDDPESEADTDDPESGSDTTESEPDLTEPSINLPDGTPTEASQEEPIPADVAENPSQPTIIVRNNHPATETTSS